MKLKNETGRRIVIEPGEALDVRRSEVRLDAERELKYISIDRLADEDDYDVPSFGMGGYGQVAEADGGTAAERTRAACEWCGDRPAIKPVERGDDRVYVCGRHDTTTRMLDATADERS